MAKTKLAPTKKDIQLTSEFIRTRGVNVFVHGPYYVNLCNPYNSRSKELGEQTPWALDRLVAEMNLALNLGMKGVVIHTGKHCKNTVEKGYEIMHDSLKYVLDNSDPLSTLIFETAAGQGTELATSPAEITDLFHKFNKSHPGRMVICMDTCHVFAAGYDPDVFLTHLLDHQVNVVLVHYNGSRDEKGCRKDRHQYVNEPDQKIPIDNMKRTLDICIQHNIPCVIE